MRVQVLPLALPALTSLSLGTPRIPAGDELQWLADLPALKELTITNAANLHGAPAHVLHGIVACRCCLARFP